MGGSGLAAVAHYKSKPTSGSGLPALELTEIWVEQSQQMERKQNDIKDLVF